VAITLRFSTECAPDSALIRWRTDAHISHVEFEREDGWTLGARLFGGVALRPPSACRRQYNVIHATFNGILEAYAWTLNNRLGAKYDALGIIGIATARDWHNKAGRFCSETILEGAEQTGIYLLSRIVKMWQISPRDLILSPLIEILSGPPAFLKRVN
jgi:hypothetical protein